MAQALGAALYDNSFTDVYSVQFDQSLAQVAGGKFYTMQTVPATTMPIATQIIVNSQGQRFVNEGAGNALVGWWMIHDKNQPYWIIYGSDGNTEDGVDDALTAAASAGNDTFVSASDAAGLASAMGLSSDAATALATTISDYNGFVTAQSDTQFNKAAASLTKQISGATLYAVKIFPNTYGSMGGIKTNQNCQVLDSQGNAIPHLYAAGEVSNRDFYNQWYVGATSLTMYSTAGRIAGVYAATGSYPWPAAPAAAAPAAAAPAEPAPAATPAAAPASSN
jgi:succinate dehydrogenase/fumarate reductase flavoprotein subunit